MFDLIHIHLSFRFFPVFSADQEKVAELQVSIVLESLMGMSSIFLVL